ncbi:DNA binding protein [Pseudomonas sp. PDM15]|uniref:histone-like nucleoid-structuring protein, MvaT/MvaU family n=1 Tax=Pseudomonas sp. PDM15 TaxID=2769303 RepID=UPI0017840A15|nr:histone-like nucleoid-structuring protein, MvaT/MvaU family [Pseudomonas sp. PDM15]MBD9427882.1 DNA binding protein [Pseudomonas sp. PDM15]
MSKLAEFKALEAQLAAQLKQLDHLKNDGELKREIEFEEKLRALLAEYGFSLKNIISILDPQARTSVAVAVSVPQGQRRKRQLKVYKNPETGEVVETKGGNHKVLKVWKEKYGAETVEGWLQ